MFLEFLLAWLVAGAIIHTVGMFFLKRMKVGTSSEYLKGYMTGITNLKMYYYSQGKMPDTQWLDKVKFHALSERDVLEATL